MTGLHHYSHMTKEAFMLTRAAERQLLFSGSLRYSLTDRFDLRDT